jgi:hypothetical protein
MPQKVFTVEQANATLPLVRAVVQDIMTLAKDVRERHQRLHRAPHKAAISPAHEEELVQARSALERDLERLRALENELTELGIQLKDYFLGLVDFPARVDGRIIYLCWKAGEAQVAHWHEIDAGFAGRRELTELPPSPAPPGPLPHSAERGSRATENRTSARTAEGTTVADGTP